MVELKEKGLLVQPGNVEDLILILYTRLLGHPDEREAMGRRARRYVEREGDSRVRLRRLEAFYSEVATRGFVHSE